MTKEEAWAYAKGMIAVDDLEPTEDFTKLIEKEIKGEITMDDIFEFFHKRYQKQGDIV